MTTRILLVAASITVVVVLTVSFFATGRAESVWIDPITGSIKHQTVYFGFAAEPTIRPTALDAWVRKKTPTYLNDWKFVNQTGYTVWNRPTFFGCAGAPEIYTLRGDAIDDFVSRCSDDELDRFVGELRNPEHDVREAAIDAAIQRLGE
jgi:hypothetical protein